MGPVFSYTHSYYTPHLLILICTKWLYPPVLERLFALILGIPTGTYFFTAYDVKHHWHARSSYCLKRSSNLSKRLAVAFRSEWQPLLTSFCVCVSFSHPGFRLGRPSRRNGVLPFLWCLLCTTRWTWVILSMICLTDAVLTLLRHDGQLKGLTYLSSLQSRSRWAFRRSPSYITFWLRARVAS